MMSLPTWPDEPARLTGHDLRPLLVWTSSLEASEVTIRAGHRARMLVHGVNHWATDRPIDEPEVNELVQEIYGNHALSHMAQGGGRDLDGRVEASVIDSRDRPIPFRYNATGALIDGMTGVEISLRRLDIDPPTPQEVGLTDDILSAFDCDQGMGLMTGPTGSGKTKTAAAIKRHMVETLQVGKILTYEAPIEFRFDNIQNERSWITQSEVGTHLSDWRNTVRNALRRLPHTIFFGELRDAEIIRSTLEAAISGHFVIGTTHTRGVAYTIRRLVQGFAASERDGLSWDLIDALRVVLYQRLVFRADGPGRIALREWLPFDPILRDRLLGTPANDWRSLIDEALIEREQTIQHDARRAYQAGLIDRDTALRVFKEAPNVLSPKELEAA